MAEAKNTFLKSKMNKDLDDRILPNGEYRDALNISVGRSEDNDVGSLENIKGNSLVAATSESNSNLRCIGKFEDETGNRIFQILTDYTDPVSNCTAITYPTPASSPEMKITVLELDTNNYSTLIQGKFLNFAKNKCWQITGINLVENLLFWTDNRNQPRKINVETALNDSSYYTEEHQISVAKYMPALPPKLYKEVDTTVVTISSSSAFKVEDITGISVGMTVVSNTPDNVGGQYINASEFLKVASINGDEVVLNAAPSQTVVVGQNIRFIETTMTNESGDPTWPGDPSYLEDKYVRFAYRFQYDDGEYSIMSPFTQIAFIPEQEGFFLYGNENEAYESSIIKWFENNVDNIKLRIELPEVGSDSTKGGNSLKNIITEYKIQNIDILYKESNGLVVKVLKTISGTTMALEMNENVYVYEYQSEKPYKTLTEGQTTRVYDKVPVRALSQDVAGNRVIYGNFKDKHTPYDTLDYNCTVQPKLDLYTSFAEYPNHTLKQNRTYQIGWVLADKFGRQSSVILSEYDTTSTTAGTLLFGGSTVFHPYYDENDSLDVKKWFGDAALVLLNQTIGNFTLNQSDRNLATGAPGLYGEPTASWVVSNSTNDSLTPNGNVSWTLTFSTPTIGALPTTDDYLRGEFVDYTKILSITSAAGVTTITTKDKPNSYYLYIIENTDEDTKFAYFINPTGWYSYKIVVKQREQDYYNAYLPGFLDGYPDEMTQGSQVNYVTTLDSGGVIDGSYAELESGINQILFPSGELDNTAHTVLLNDNINKIPRDLSEVGPDQRQYRSSVELYGRVNNIANQFSITAFSWLGGTGAGADQVNEIYFTGPNDPTNTAVFCPGNSCTGLEEPLEVGMALLMAKCEYVGGTLANCVSGDQDFQYPERFSNATTITKIVYDSTTDRTTVSFSPGGAINQSANHLIVEYGDNTQYYPVKKADIASTIGTAEDLGFYEFSVDNFNGSAARNLYQLETNPIIARFSTNKKIGVIAADMVPWLSIYETAPVDSLLDIFWETTTGWNYISDINQDVLAGSDNPTGFSDTGFTFIENQDYLGTNSNISTAPTGAADSPWITDIFYPRNNTGVNLTNTTATMTVETAAGLNVSGDFALEQLPTTDPNEPGGYRVKFIGRNHVFLNSAESVESFTFSLAILYPAGTAAATTTTRTFTGKLQNFAPSFDLPCSDYTTVTGQLNTGTVVDFNGKNGTTRVSQNTDDLYWTITAGNASSYFIIDNSTGTITLNQALGTPAGSQLVPLGVYTLTVQLQDAVSGGVPLTTASGGADFNSKTATCLVTITVGPEMVPDFYQGYYLSDAIWAEQSNSSTPCSYDLTSGNYLMTGGWYFGPRQNGASNPAINNTQTPVPCDDIQFPGGIRQDLGQALTPVAFDKGTLLISPSIENIMSCDLAGDGECATNQSYIREFRIYHRAASSETPNNNTWVLIDDANGAKGPNPTDPVSDSTGNPFKAFATGRANSGGFANSSSMAGYKIIDGDKLPGEYFVTVHASIWVTGVCQWQCFCDPNGGGVDGNYQGYVTLETEDANFNYTAVGQGSLYSYPYTVQQLGGTGGAFPTGTISPTETLYAHAKYGISVRQFFTDSSLLTPWEPAITPAGGQYHSFAGGIRQQAVCTNSTLPCASTSWGLYLNNSSVNNCNSGWTGTEPQNMRRPGAPQFRGKFSSEGTIIEGYSTPTGYGSSANLFARTACRQSFNGTYNTTLDYGFPMVRNASMVGNNCF